MMPRRHGRSPRRDIAPACTPTMRGVHLLASLAVAQIAAVGSSSGSYRSPTSGDTVDVWDGAGGPAALHKEYGRIFTHGNRNAASHLWSTFLLERARFMPKKRFLTLAGSYCAVSGSPVDPSDGTRYRMRLPHVDGSGKVSTQAIPSASPAP